MPEGTEEQQPQGGQAAESTQTQTQTPAPVPPWEKNGQEFNAERAWTLIQNLTSERDNLKADKATIQQGQSDLMTKLADALGVKREEAGEDIVGTLQQQVAAMQLDRDVERLARVHKLADDDVEALRKISDPNVRATIAERLAKGAARGPLPDPSQGAKPVPPKPDPGKGQARIAAAYAESNNH